MQVIVVVEFKPASSLAEELPFFFLQTAAFPRGLDEVRVKALLRNLRFSLRMLRKNSGLTVGTN
jgi:hypothetical protein